MSMEQCVFPIPDGACLVIILQGVMQIVELVHTLAVGNMLLWKRQGRENICRFMKMNGERIFLIQKICV